MKYHKNKYDRSKLSPGAVHLGFGNFARAFYAHILDEVAGKGYTDLGLVAVAPSDRQALDFKILSQQENIYHLLRQNGDEICSPIRVLVETIIGASNHLQVIDTLTRATTQIVTLTITGDGYFPETPEEKKTRDVQNDDIRALKKRQWAKLQTPPGWIIAALYKRYTAGQKPFVVMSCDNMLFNGDKTHKLLMRLAKETDDAGFTDYVQNAVLCPNTAVDRITPQQNYDAQTAYLTRKANHANDEISPEIRLHLKSDKRPVISEDHRELIIEDTGRFPVHLREAFACAGVGFVEDITPYQDRKVRLLNGAHMLCGIGGKLLQIETVRDAMKDKDLRTLCDHLLNQSASSLAATQPEGEDVRGFVNRVIERFENPHLTDQTARLVSKTHAKIHARFLNSYAIDCGDMEADASAFAIAMWVRYLQGRDESGNPYSLDPADVGIAQKLGLSNINSPDFQDNLCRFLAGKELSEVSGSWYDFTAQIVDAAQAIQEKGLRVAIRQYYPAKPPAHAASRNARPVDIADPEPA